MGRPGSSGGEQGRATRQAIAEALRRVDLLRDPEGRKMCIQFSEQEIGESICNQLRGQAVVSARRGVQGCPARASRMACMGGTALSLMVIR